MTVEDTDGLLDLISLRDLHGGPLGFHRHIVDLFEKERVYSYAVDFAKIAMQFTALARPDEVSPPNSFRNGIANLLHSQWGTLRTIFLTASFPLLSKLLVSTKLILHFLKWVITHCTFYRQISYD
jgi:hypothetical protein